MTIDRDTVLLDGGPRDGWSYYAEDWQQQLDSATHLGHAAPPYVETDEIVPHPLSEAARARIWVYTGAGGSRRHRPAARPRR